MAKIYVVEYRAAPGSWGVPKKWTILRMFLRAADRNKLMRGLRETRSTLAEYRKATYVRGE